MESLTQLPSTLMFCHLSNSALICTVETMSAIVKPEKRKKQKALTFKFTNRKLHTHPLHIPLARTLPHGHTSVQRSLGNVVFNRVAMSQLNIGQT